MFEFAKHTPSAGFLSSCGGAAKHLVTKHTPSAGFLSSIWETAAFGGGIKIVEKKIRGASGTPLGATPSVAIEDM